MQRGMLDTVPRRVSKYVRGCGSIPVSYPSFVSVSSGTGHCLDDDDDDGGQGGSPSPSLPPVFWRHDGCQRQRRRLSRDSRTGAYVEVSARKIRVSTSFPVDRAVYEEMKSMTAENVTSSASL